MKCLGCNEIEVGEPEYCCNGYMCGCMGKPIDPPYCNECLSKMIPPQFSDEGQEV